MNVRAPRAVSIVVAAMSMACATGVTAAAAAAETVDVEIAPVRDTSIWDAATPTASGAGPSLFAGRNGGAGGAIRQRALIAFDVAAAVPAEARIISADLVLHLEQFSGSGAQLVAIHRAGAAWGEGPSVAGGGSGAPAQPGDATWDERFLGELAWRTPGGDFEASPSAVLAVAGPVGSRTWTGAGLLADVRAWHAAPSTAHGWIVVGGEASGGTSRRFTSREGSNVDARPRLVVRYVIDADDCDADVSGDGVVDFDDLLAVLGDWGICPLGPCESDVDADGTVGLRDLLIVLSTWGPCR